MWTVDWSLQMNQFFESDTKFLKKKTYSQKKFR